MSKMKVKNIEKLSLEHARWYGAKQECYKVTFAADWAPTEKFAIINERGFFDANTATGYIRGNGNLGSASLLFAHLECFKNENN